jgi:large subunit ribosomal protein L25
MEQKVLTIEIREKVGKGTCRRLRSNGMVPAVVYGKGIDSVSVSVDQKELMALVSGKGGMNSLLTLKGGGALDGNVVIVTELTRDCLKGLPVHADLHRVKMEEKVKVKVPLMVKGTARGVKEGGLLDVLLHSLEVECLPAGIPGSIEVDITNMGLGTSLHVSDIQAPEGVRILDDPKAAIVSVLGKGKEAEEAASQAE